MTPREELETLAAKVEAAEGADRILDTLIHEHLCDGFDMMPDASAADVAALLPDGADVDAFVEACGGFAVVDVPEYTASLQQTAAALRARASALTGYGEKG